MNDFNHAIEYSVIGAYLIMMIAVGLVFRRFNHNTGDFFRSGCQGTWWLVGMSSFMSSISALTFTGNGGAAFEAGWSVAAIYLGNVVGLGIQALVLAPWFRQMRATTFPELLRERFGPLTQQVFAYIKMVVFTFVASLWLYGLSVFASATFSLPIGVVITVLGLVALFYPMLGGKWAVMAGDFLQGIIMMSLLLLLSGICLVKLGGFAGLANLVAERGLSEHFSFVKPAGLFPEDLYSWRWIIAVFLISVIANCGMSNAIKFFAVKDGREARKAAALSGLLMLAGTIFWFIPPMTARLLYESDVLAVPLSNPAEASMAVLSVKLLPTGLVGMMVVAIFAATMSSMDTGINGNAAIFIKDALPALRRRLGLGEAEEKSLLVWSRLATVCFGFVIILLAHYVSRLESHGIFDLMLLVGSVIGIPITVPTILCLFIKRVPPWSALFSVALASLPAFVHAIWPDLMTFQTRTLLSLGLGASAFCVTIPFWKASDRAYAARVEAFFERMKRPVDFEKEVGVANDSSQLTLIGRFSLAVAAFIALLLLLPNPWQGRLAIAVLALIAGTIGVSFTWLGARKREQQERLLARVNCLETASAALAMEGQEETR